MNIETFKTPLRRIKRNLLRFFGKIDRNRFSEIDHIFEVLARSTSKQATMVDVGAQFGESFTPFMRLGWRVVAFEPDSNPRKQLALGALVGPKVKLRKVAVADREQPDAAFFTSEESTGISSLAAFRESHRESARVSVSTLTRELATEGLTQIDFLKIDAEGHDLFVLRGFPWHESRLKPRAILCEFEDSKTRPLGYSWVDMAEYLQSQGYAVFVSEWYPIVRYGVQHRWRTIARYPRVLEDANGWGNLVALCHVDDVCRFESLVRPYLAK